MSKLDDATLNAVRNLEAKTGRSLADWVTLVRRSGQEKHGQMVAWLKAEHGMGHGYANLVALEAREGAITSPPASADEGVAAVFAGDKAGLLPLYQAIEAYVRSLGEVEVAPKKANVSLRRSRQFALVQPSTRTRLDLGLQLKGLAPEGRLEASGSFSAMVSHRVRLEQASDFDSAVKGWLKAAYEAA
ncbi:MAG TPA: DUF4287 domain-containing protein [Caulobacter sp.]|nr:DUF4287 domain-containing protein [Caulobacter sp.]